jgi:prepilin-type N-terminal cleavage/methylation domain-containing protein
MRITLGKTTAGWTLVEIMIAVTLIGMLAGISVPGMFKARDTSAINTIRHNLRMIDDVKEQWALENRIPPGTTPLDSDILAYFKGSTMPKPVIGETYDLNAIGDSATATIPMPLGSYAAGTVLTHLQ